MQHNGTVLNGYFPLSEGMRIW